MADDKLSESEVSSLIDEFETDLTAFFRMMESDINGILVKGTDEGWTPEKIVHEIDRVLGEK
jgi:hypothetical protein